MKEDFFKTCLLGQNQRLAQLEMIKERFHRMFEISHSYQDAMNELGLCYEWCYQLNAKHLMKYFWSLVDRMEFYNYFKHRITSVYLRASIEPLKH